MARSRTRSYLGRKAIERLPGPVFDLFGPAVLRAVDEAVERRWQGALDRAAAIEAADPASVPGEPTPELVKARVKELNRRFRRELAAVGAATGAVAATPGIGTGLAASALVADVSWLALRATDLVMAIGAIHGHTDASVEERRAWVLSVLAFGDSAADEFTTLVDAVDIRILPDAERLTDGLGRAAGLAGSDAVTVEAIRRVNTNLASQVLTRYGSRRGAIALGKLLPLGIGAVWGASSTWALIRTVGGHADRFFREYPLPRQLPAGEEGS